MPKVDVTDLSMNIRTAVTIAFVLLSASAVYFGQKAKIDTLTEAVQKLETQAEAQGRAVIEMSTALRMKEILK